MESFIYIQVYLWFLDKKRMAYIEFKFHFYCNIMCIIQMKLSRSKGIANVSKPIFRLLLLEMQTSYRHHATATKNVTKTIEWFSASLGAKRYIITTKSLPFCNKEYGVIFHDVICDSRHWAADCYSAIRKNPESCKTNYIDKYYTRFRTIKKSCSLEKTPEDNFAPDGKITTMTVGAFDVKVFPLEPGTYSVTLVFLKLCYLC